MLLKYTCMLPFEIYNDTSVCNLNLFYDLGKDGCGCVCLGKMAVVAFVTLCGFCKQKQNFVDHFCLLVE